MQLINPQYPPSVAVSGETYYPDENGIYDVPDTLIPLLRQRGFVSAAAYLQSRQAATPPLQPSGCGGTCTRVSHPKAGY